MRVIHRKLFRDLWGIKGQVLAIGAVIAAGIAMFTMYLSTFHSLHLTQETYYDRYRFGDVFASLKRAPLALEEEIAAIPGVADVETRVVVDVTLDVPGMTEAVTGRLISVPAVRERTLDDVFLRRGRYLEPHRSDEVLVSEAFADAHGLGPGDEVAAVINGRRRNLAIVGVALSPEYVYSIRPGDLFPDDRRFGLFWMEQRALAAAFDMEGGFNDVALELMRGADGEEVIARLDGLLEPYGGLGAIPRALQVSHWYLTAELTALSKVGLFIPIIFLGVAAFLLNVALTRIISVQREQIAALKALGYANLEVGLHYAQWAFVVSLGGAVVGLVGGAWLGSGMTGLYNQYFRFPEVVYRLRAGVVAGALLFAVAAALGGAWSSVRRAVRLPPAEAMRPEPPPSFRKSLIERIGLSPLLSPSWRIVWRNLERQATRSVLSVVGIAFAGAMLVVGMFSLDSIDVLMDTQFNLAQRQDLTVSFVEPVSGEGLFALEALPGVLAVEPMRSVPVRLRAGPIARQVAVTGLPASAWLNRLVDADAQAMELPPEGLVLSQKLAELLALEPGDSVRVEVLTGSRPQRTAQVAATVDDYTGLSAYMEIGALSRLLREGVTLSGAALLVDSAAEASIHEALKATPKVAGVSVKRAALEAFQQTLAENIGLMIFFNVGFAGVIAFGVVYNAARVSLSERSRELASLRVLGFTRQEIGTILLGELAVITAVAVPLGLLLGLGLAGLVVLAYDTELYRMPLVVWPRTYGFAAATVVVATVLSGLIVRRKLGRLDLVAVLKTRE